MISSDSTRDWPLQTSRALPMASDWVAVLLDQHAIDVPLFPRILPSLQPVANAISRTDERNLPISIAWAEAQRRQSTSELDHRTGNKE